MTFDNETRARLVREWMRSPLKQTEFCAAHGISTRVLREWKRRLGTRRHAAARGTPIGTSLADLQRRLADLDAAVAAALGAVAACRAALDDQRVPGAAANLAETAVENAEEAHGAATSGMHESAAPNTGDGGSGDGTPTRRGHGGGFFRDFHAQAVWRVGA